MRDVFDLEPKTAYRESMLDVNLPEPLSSYVSQQTRDGGYDNEAAYLAELVRRDMEDSKLERLLEIGEQSGFEAFDRSKIEADSRSALAKNK